MQTSKIDFGRLLGFETVSELIEGRPDLQDENLGAKLGAKVGDPPVGPALASDE